MRVALALLILCSAGVVKAESLVLAEELEGLQGCLDRLTEADGFYRRWMPEAILYGDLRVRHMSLGIVPRRAIAKRIEERGPGAGAAHMASNSTLDCRRYLSQYRTRVRWYVSYLSSQSLFWAVFISHVFITFGRSRAGGRRSRSEPRDRAAA